jgi:radical SAM protein with 4Fe4S-binding SPASM domain
MYRITPETTVYTDVTIAKIPSYTRSEWVRISATMATFAHFLITRFNVRIFYANPPDVEWLEHRFQLFDRFCYPSVFGQSTQNFKWIVLFDEQTPEHYRQRIQKYAQWENFCPVYVPALENSQAVQQAVRLAIIRLIQQQFPEPPAYLITSRVDNDDALCTRFLELVQQQFHQQAFQFVNFPQGYVWNEGKVYLHPPYPQSPFVSLIEKVGEFTPDGLQTVFCQNHHEIHLMGDQFKVVEVDCTPAWMQVVHGKNIYNHVKGIRQPIAGIKNHFKLDPSCISSTENQRSFFLEQNIDRARSFWEDLTKKIKVMNLNCLKSAVPQPWKQQIKSKLMQPLQPLKRKFYAKLSYLKDRSQERYIQTKTKFAQFLQLRWEYVRGAISTEYNFRFRRTEIQQHLQKIRSLPRGIYIEATNICNAKCTFCAYPLMERPKQTMPMDIFERIVDEYIELGGKYVGLTPIVGDPFVDAHIFDRLDYLDRRPEIAGFHFYTNAILMKPKVIEKLLKYGKKLKIFVSWGGFDRQTYKDIMGVDYFDLVQRNIEAFVAAKQHTRSLTQLTIALRCPTIKLYGELWNQFCQWEQQGLIAIEGHVMEYDSWAGKVNATQLKTVGLNARLMPHKRGACEMLYTKPVVLANGKVNACSCRDVEAELIVGDLHESNLKEIWKGEGIDSIIERHERGDFPDVCKRCTWYVSVYNRHQSTIFNPWLNWSEEGEEEARRLW